MVLTNPSSWLQLANKTAVVTGAASGIGAAVVRGLLEQGCHVIMADRDEERMHKIVAAQQQQQQHSAKKHGGGTVSSIVQCDVSQEDNVRRLFHQANINSAHSPATILVNCAGITRDGWIGRMSLDQWQQVQNVNLTGTFLCCREFLNQPKLLQGMNDMKKGSNEKMMSSSPTIGGGASIINISSVVATQGNLGQVNYAASKGGVWSMTKALAREVASRSIRVNCVLPGFIDTEMTRAVPEHVRQQIQSKIVYQQKFGTTDDIANLILFLASDERSGYITGQAIECSGMISL